MEDEFNRKQNEITEMGSKKYNYQTIFKIVIKITIP